MGENYEGAPHRAEKRRSVPRKSTEDSHQKRGGVVYKRGSTFRVNCGTTGGGLCVPGGKPSFCGQSQRKAGVPRGERQEGSPVEQMPRVEKMSPRQQASSLRGGFIPDRRGDFVEEKIPMMAKK